jgi:hypothetical protein
MQGFRYGAPMPLQKCGDVHTGADAKQSEVNLDIQLLISSVLALKPSNAEVCRVMSLAFEIQDRHK